MAIKTRMNYLLSLILRSGLIWVLLVSLVATPVYATPVKTAEPLQWLQFASGGHVVGFASDGVLLANGDHALRETFIGTSGVAPETDVSDGATGSVQPLGKVQYNDLWQGIDLLYDAPVGSILRSTYTIDPGADPGQIQLSYNVPVRLAEDGSLVFDFETGELRASAPIAWQEIDGEREPVDVEFQIAKDREVNRIAFHVGEYNMAYSLVIDPTLTWNTFLGSSIQDNGFGIAVDYDNNIYVVGESSASWGNPRRGYSGYSDAFVAKLNSSGTLVWNIFLGSPGYENGRGITVDNDGNVYVTGGSSSTWGTPSRAFAGEYDAFAAKLNSNGTLVWNTFLGSQKFDMVHGIAVDSEGNTYIAGTSNATWGSPYRAYAGEGTDVFVTKLNNSGTLIWNTFLGSIENDIVAGISVDSNGNSYVIGRSLTTWGNPVNAISGFYDVFAAKLNSNGTLVWNTFLGSTEYDEGYAITVDGDGNTYLTGHSFFTWGNPINAHAGFDDAFVAKINNNGFLVWNTFLGSTTYDYGYGIDVDDNRNVYLTGYSEATWGNPDNAYAGGESDAFVAKLDSSGSLTWNTFLGSELNDYGRGITVNSNMNIYVVGYSTGSWGNPVNASAGDYETFVARIDIPSPIVQGIGQTIKLGDNTPTTEDDTDFGVVKVDNASIVHTFSLLNSGEGTLTLTGSPTVEIGGTNAADFFLSTDPNPSVLSGEQTTFAIQFTPHGVGLRQAVISIANNSDEGAYTFAIQGTGSSAPMIAPQDVNDLTMTGVTLNSLVNPNYATADVSLEYGLTSDYGSSAQVTPSTLIGGSDSTVSATLSGLLPNTTYHYRFAAVNADGTSYQDDQTFITLPAAPAAITGAATAVTSSGATLNGTVNPNNQETTVKFEYGLTMDYSFTASADQSPLTGSSSAPVNVPLTGLKPGATYHFRVVAVNSTGTTYGEDRIVTIEPQTEWFLFVPLVAR